MIEILKNLGFIITFGILFYIIYKIKEDIQIIYACISAIEDKKIEINLIKREKYLEKKIANCLDKRKKKNDE